LEFRLLQNAPDNTATTIGTAMTTHADPAKRSVACTGISGLDNILSGGLVRNRLYLLEGLAGSGKTTLAMQFLLEGARRGETVLYVTLSETEEEIRDVADSHGWSLDGITIRDFGPTEAALRPDDQYTMFHPSEVELGSTMRAILADVEALRPSRAAFDSLSELRLLAGNSLRFRRQILALKQFLIGRNCTVLLLDDMSAEDLDRQVQSIAHGVIGLEQLHPEYGAERRRMRVIKYRGVKFRGGFHDFSIRRGGVQVFSRLVAADHREPTRPRRLRSGIVELDTLLGGGLESGTSTLIVGAAGTGKSTLASQFSAAAAARGEKAALFIFDEGRETLLTRADGLKVPIREHVNAGNITVQQIDPAELSPGELCDAIQRAVETQKVSVVVIDSLNGYLNAMPGERFLAVQLHELLMYLNQQGVATLLIGAHQGLIGSNMVTPVDASYLADAVILLRYFESKGEVRQAISVVKKRGGEHERTIREFSLSSKGITIGRPLREFRGVLTGVPVLEAQSKDTEVKP
jgi:circadian clock protein KaiC